MNVVPASESNYYCAVHLFVVTVIVIIIIIIIIIIIMNAFRFT